MSLTEQQTRRNTAIPAPARRLQPVDNGPVTRKSTEQAKVPPGRSWLWFVLVLLANYLLVRLLIPSPEAPITVPYTLFKQEVGKNNVEAIYSQGDTITGRFTTPITYPPLGEKSAAPGGETQTDERTRWRPGHASQAVEYSRLPCPPS